VETLAVMPVAVRVAALAVMPVAVRVAMPGVAQVETLAVVLVVMTMVAGTAR
jgi:hypothetical protein